MPAKSPIARSILLLSFLLISGCFLVFLQEYFANAKKETPNSSHIMSHSLKARDCGSTIKTQYSVECFYFYTHANDGATIGFRLPVALLQNKASVKSATNSTTPLLIRIPGGPGEGFQTTEDQIDYWLLWMEQVNAQFDLLLYDPRGTGQSSPSLTCPSYDEISLKIVEQNMSAKQEIALTDPPLLQCLEALSDQVRLALRNNSSVKEGDGIVSQKSYLSEFSSIQQAKDVKTLAEALQYQDVHVWGTSYGTRVALLAARYEVVKSLILDSPYPLNKNTMLELPFIYQQSMALHEALYSPDASLDIGSFMELFTRINERLKASPPTIRVKSWLDGREVKLVLTPERFYGLNIQVLYTPEEVQGYYDGLVEWLNTGEISENLQVILDDFFTYAFDEQFNYLVYFATECADSVEVDEAQFNALVELNSVFAPMFIAMYQQDLCRSALFSETEPVHDQRYVDKPTLIFAGEFDPVTPLVWAKELRDQLPSSLLVAVEGAGHAVLGNEECGWAFLNDGLGAALIKHESTQLLTCEHTVH